VRRSKQSRAWLKQAAIVAVITVASGFVLSRPNGSLVAQQTPRPAGWNAATHGSNAKPDYNRLFSLDRVHELHITIAGHYFRAMQEDLRTIARDRIAQTRVRDIKPALFHAAARKAGQQAIDAAARQDFDTAIRAKQQEATSLALYREATRVVADLEARVKAAQVLDQPGSRKRVGLAGASYQQQIDAILDRYEFASITAKALDKRIALRAWIVELEKDGMAVSLPAAMIDDARRISYKELTADELVTVSDTLRGLVHLARLKNRLLKNEDARAFVVIVTSYPFCSHHPHHLLGR